MNTYLMTLGLASLPVLSNIIGGILAEVLPISRRRLGLALHVTVGVLLAIATVELIPRSLQGTPQWIPLLTLFLGGSFFIVSNALVSDWQKRIGNQGHHQIAWIIFFSNSVHLLSEGVMIGTSVTIAQQLGLVLAIARVIAHIPLGFATLAEFKQHKTSRPLRLGLIISLIVPMLLGATLGYGALRGQAEIFKLAILAFTTGILITAVVEDIIPEAHKTQDTPLSNLFFIGSFTAFAIFLIYIA